MTLKFASQRERFCTALQRHEARGPRSWPSGHQSQLVVVVNSTIPGIVEHFLQLVFEFHCTHSHQIR